jgi:hypothetical protein
MVVRDWLHSVIDLLVEKQLIDWYEHCGQEKNANDPHGI